MDPNPGNFPILSYVMSRLPSFGGRSPTGAATAASPSNSHSHNFDLEQPPHSDRPSPSSSASPSSIVGRMPNLTDPEILASMIRAISDVSQARSVLKLIGPRPTHEEVDDAKAKLVDLEAHLSRQLEEIVGHPRPPEIDEPRWRAHIAQKENACKESAEKEKRILKSLIQLDVMHASYEKLLKDAESRLVKIYEDHGQNDNDTNTNENDNDNDGQVEEILHDAYGKGVERVDLSGKHLRHLPDAFSHLPALVVLDISANQLSAIPDSISGLQNLEELNVSSNGLESLPDTIGLLQKLKLLNVSGNKLCALPDSISLCKELVELDAGFNSLTYLPTNIGYQLHNLQRMMIQLNKIRSLPSSVCEMKSLRYLDAHFNELHGLPNAIGKLTNLEVLNLSSNFTDLQVLPETFGDLISLRELDLSNNQIHALPDTFGRLDNLTKLNLDQNPLEVPPLEIANQGVQAVRSFMLKRWADLLAEEERKSPQASQEDGQNDWVTRSTSWLKNVSDNVSEIISPRTPKTSFLDQQL